MTVDGTNLSAMLAAAGIFAELADDIRADVSAAARRRLLPAGTWLFRQGDLADSLYMVGSGCLEIVVESPPPARVVGTMFRGGVLGELGLLTRQPRSASARARRDSVVLELTRERFDQLIEHDPRFPAALLEILGAKLAQTETLQPMPSTVPRVWCPVAAGPSSRQQLPRLREMLRDSAHDVRVGMLQDPGGDDIGRAETLDRAEADNDVVILDVGADDGEWALFARRQADRLLLVVDPRQDPLSTASCDDVTDVVFLGTQPQSQVTAWQAACRAPARYVLPGGAADAAGVRRLARRLLGRATGVVLSGGGARGLAHIGVLDALKQAGREVDRIGGTSMGAFVAAMHANGMTPAAMLQLCRSELVARRPFRDLTVPRTALVKGRAARDMLDRVFEQMCIEALPLDYFCVAADLVAADVVVHRTGRLADAVLSSMAVPGWMPPVPSGERLLVDGGLLDNLPIDVMAATGEGPVIGVDVMGRFAAAPDGRLPRLVDTLARATTLGSWRSLAASRNDAELVITPALAGVGLTDFDQLDRAVALGRQAALEALAGT